MNKKNISNLLFAFWIYTIIVILWGAWVRISHSGNGCGDHWPLCGGEFIPTAANAKTLVEYSHRMMSGLYGLIVFYCYYVFRKPSYSKTTNQLPFLMLIFMLIEAAVGALLVKGQLVTVNDSVSRLVVMSLHQLNSFLLTAVTYLLHLSVTQNFQLKFKKIFYVYLGVCVLGAFASLSTTLFPSISLMDGILDDLNSSSHLFVKLRILHPLIATAVALGLVYHYLNKKKYRLMYEVFFAMLVGILTILTLSPVWLKISHLLIAHYLWARILKTELVEE